MKHRITHTKIRSKRIRLTAREDIHTDDIEQYRKEILQTDKRAIVLFTYDTNEPYNPIPQP